MRIASAAVVYTLKDNPHRDYAAIKPGWLNVILIIEQGALFKDDEVE